MRGLKSFTCAARLFPALNALHLIVPRFRHHAADRFASRWRSERFSCSGMGRVAWRYNRKLWIGAGVRSAAYPLVVKTKDGLKAIKREVRRMLRIVASEQTE